jgi:3',5'-nucleoside bisphosphate phosphatase
MKFADLHMHTDASDGTHPVERVIDESVKAGLSCIAITDHDTVSSIAPAIEIARQKDIEVIPAIEFTCEFNGSEVHILGYLIDHKNQELLSQLVVLRQNRIERIYKIVDKLKAAGVELDPQSIFRLSNNGTIGRLHVARAMVKEAKVGSIYEAFQRYIGDSGPAYVLGFRLSPVDVIRTIVGAGGIPVLAHPYLLRNDDLIPEFIHYGIRGLEIYYPEHSQSMVNFYLQLAREHGLLVTGGSDYHGSAKPDVKVGSIKIPYELVQKLKDAKEGLL